MDRHQHDRRLVVRHVQRLGAVDLLLDEHVVAVDEPENRQHQRDRQDGDPCPFDELRGQDDARAVAVATAPTPFTQSFRLKAAPLDGCACTRIGSVPGASVALGLAAREVCPWPLLRQCMTMPDCDSVKARNAPTAYSGISRSVMPPNAASSSPEAAARNNTPTE